MTTNAIDPQTGLTENSSLDDRACALAMAQCASIEQPHTWLEAYHELEEMNDDSAVPQSFAVCDWIDESEGWDSVFNQVNCEADAIKAQLKAAFAMGVKSAESIQEAYSQGLAVSAISSKPLHPLSDQGGTHELPNWPDRD